AIFHLFSVNVTGDADVYRAAGTALARIFLIQIFFYGFTALATALLNAHRRYFAAAWSPVLSNVVIIATLALVPQLVDHPPPPPPAPTPPRPGGGGGRGPRPPRAAARSWRPRPPRRCPGPTPPCAGPRTSGPRPSRI